jgi:sigma-B regulation protein RsbU (phosphoserine phosphatase)
MIVRASTGAVEEFSADGMPLGISDRVRFAVKSTNLEDGDLVVMYTDGVTDARYGDDRLEAAGVTEFLTQHRLSPPQTIVDELFHKLQTECELSDDATVVVMQLVGDEAPPAEGLSAPAVEE